MLTRSGRVAPERDRVIRATEWTLVAAGVVLWVELTWRYARPPIYSLRFSLPAVAPLVLLSAILPRRRLTAVGLAAMFVASSAALELSSLFVSSPYPSWILDIPDFQRDILVLIVLFRFGSRIVERVRRTRDTRLSDDTGSPTAP